MVQRLTRSERAAVNRTSLLAAARVVFLRDGFHGATVDAIAAEAGFTIGAVYSRFSGKADLFLALLEQRIEERIRTDFQPSAAAERREVSAAAARQWAEIMRSDLDWTLLVIEFRVHAARDPELADRFARLHARLLEFVVDHLGGSLDERTAEEREQIEDAARAVMAFGHGAALARVAEGDAFSDDLVERTHVAITEHLRPPANVPSGR